MNVVIKLLERVEQWAERLVGAVVTAVARVLSKLLRRGQHRDWRRPR